MDDRVCIRNSIQIINTYVFIGDYQNIDISANMQLIINSHLGMIGENQSLREQTLTVKG
jgi:hypothetical protein